MSARQQVLATYASARVQCFARLAGRGGPINYVVWNGTIDPIKRLGEGPTKAKAWKDAANNLETLARDEADLLRMEKFLNEAAWVRRECGNWEDPISGIHEPFSRAYLIAMERARMRRVRARLAKPLAIVEVKMKGKWVPVYEIAEWKAECGWSSRLLEPITEIRVTYVNT